MADYPANIWVRDPIIDGRPYKGGAMTRAVALLKQCRDELTAMETELGTDPAGSAVDLKTRLAMRHSLSGIPRGRVYRVGGNDSGKAGNWFNTGALNFEAGLASGINTGSPVITFSIAYSVAPSVVVACFVAEAAILRLGDVQVTSITTTQFTCRVKMFNAASAFGAPVVGNTCAIAWFAFGGS